MRIPMASRMAFDGVVMTLALLLTTLGVQICPARAADPIAQPGLDPGGIAVAFVGGGVDYTRPQIAFRLARDGEGEPIGWDYVENDARPYEACPERPSAPLPVCSTTAAIAVLEEAPAARLVVLRAVSEQPQTLVRSVGFAAQSGVRIVLVAPPDGLNPAFVQQAAERYPQLLFVVPAVGTSEAVNVVSVVGVGTSGTIGTSDLATTVPEGSSMAVAPARLAALAARLLAENATIDAAGLKSMIVGLAKPLPWLSGLRTRHGWIEQPAAQAPAP